MVGNSKQIVDHSPSSRRTWRYLEICMLEKSQEMIVIRFPKCHEYPEASGSGNMTRTFWIMIFCLLGEHGHTWRYGSSS